MKLYLISQTVNNGYDTYDSAVVAAEDEVEASKIHPSGESYRYDDERNRWYYFDRDANPQSASAYDWVHNRYDVNVAYLGEADVAVKRGIVVLASFNAG